MRAKDWARLYYEMDKRIRREVEKQLRVRDGVKEEKAKLRAEARMNAVRYYWQPSSLDREESISAGCAR